MPTLTSEYVRRMEDVLRLYARPLNPREPVVCLDERPVQLHKNARETIRANRPGTILKRDYEYVRCGTANVFCAVEPKAGRHLTKATKTRSGPEFAKMAARVVRAYPRARKIHLVMDNLSTHSEKSLTDFYGRKRGAKLWCRFKVHPTPKHASWLNQAEMEIGLFSRQCLGKERVEDVRSLRFRASAWNRRVNRERVKIDWKFAVSDARRRFKYDAI